MRYNVIPHLLVNGHGKLLKQQGAYFIDLKKLSADKLQQIGYEQGSADT